LFQFVRFHSAKQPKIESDELICLASGIKISRSQLIQLLGSQLLDLGFNQTSKSLESESGVDCVKSCVVELRDFIYQENWSSSMNLLKSLRGDTAGMNSIWIENVLSIIIEQRYLQFVQESQFAKGLAFFRQEIQSGWCPGEMKMEKLAMALLAPSREPKSRGELVWSCVCSEIPPHMLVPRNQLLDLIESAIMNQFANCKFHNKQFRDIGLVSLVTPHLCSPQVLPFKSTLSFMNNHAFEVWVTLST
jgi:hypothetical protein